MAYLRLTSRLMSFIVTKGAIVVESLLDMRHEEKSKQNGTNRHTLCDHLS